MKIKDFYQKKAATQLCFVKNTSSVEDVYKTLMKNKEPQIVYVLNPKKKLVGFIDIKTLLNLYGAQFSSGPIDTLTQFSKLLAHKASDLMNSPIYVRLDNDIKVAVKAMEESSLYEIPIVNSENKVIGKVTCHQLLGVLKENQKKN